MMLTRGRGIAEEKSVRGKVDCDATVRHLVCFLR